MIYCVVESLHNEPQGAFPRRSAPGHARSAHPSHAPPRPDARSRHRHAIQRTSEDLLGRLNRVALSGVQRLEARGWIAASWELSDKGKRAKYYRLTALGRKQLFAEQSKWEAFARAMGLVLDPTGQEGS